MIIRKTDKLADISRLGESVFHTRDLASLWQIQDLNTLYTQIKRYVKRGILFRIYKGFYSIKPADQIDPFLLGVKALHKFCYVSAETVLSREGIIQQHIGQITLISSESRRFEIGRNKYHSRKLADRYLYNPAGIENKNGIYIANISRAIADMLYFNPKAYFDASRLINWKDVQRIQKEIGYPIISNNLILLR